MFITQEVLEKYEACEFGRKLIARLYPDGVEIMELLDNKRIPMEVFHWGKKMLPTTLEEIEKYWEVCRVTDSDFIYSSTDIARSTWVEESRNITSSHGITHSNKVTNSSLIIGSDRVTDSRRVSGSKDVTCSKNVYGSEKILNSDQISVSREIENSNGVASSVQVRDSFNVYNSQQINNSAFISNSQFLDNCCFCCDASYGKNLLFNQPADEALIREIYDKISMDYHGEIMQPVFIDGEHFVTRVTHNINFGTFYSEISKEFWNWVKTLPNYDPMLMYRMTYLPIWLED